MSIRLKDNENDIFASYDIRKALITNLNKYKSVSAPRACECLGVNYNDFYKVYLNKDHPIPNEVAEVINVTMFKNILKLFGLELKYTLYLQTNDYSEKDASEVIRARIKRNRIISGKDS